MADSLSAPEIDLLLADYQDLEVGGHTTVSFAAGIQWVNVNAELAARGLRPLKDYTLQKSSFAYPGMVTFSLARLTDKYPGERKAAKPKGTGKRGAVSKFDSIMEDAITDLIMGRTPGLDMSTGWSKEKRTEAYATAALVMTQLSGNQ